MYLKIRLLLSVFVLVSSMTFAQQESLKEVKEKPKIKIGGALRYNYNLSSWKDGQKDRGGDFGLDVFRLNTVAEYKGLKLDAEYRWYAKESGGGMLKHGWIGYAFNENEELQLGLSQVPFGISPYTSNSWFFSINYYVGLEDDNDMGLKYLYRSDNWDIDLAFYKNAEELRFGSNSDISDDRYSYDVASIDVDGQKSYRNKEINQVNGRVCYKFGDDVAKHKLGASLEYGGLYNLDTEETGDHYACACHYELSIGKFSSNLQVATYKYSAKNPAEESDDIIALTAYGAPYFIASEATVYSAGIAYNVPVKWGPISSLKFYEEYGYLTKSGKDLYDSQMNVFGVLITAGNIYTYVDYAMGKNHPWLGGDWNNGFGTGVKNASWEARFNINFGYYF